MKPFLWTIGVSLLFVAALCCCIFGAIFFDRSKTYEAYYPFGPPYTLAERNGKLVVLNNQVLVKVLQIDSQSSKKISALVLPQKKSLGYELAITANSKQYRRAAIGIDCVTIAPDQTSVCFIETSLAKELPAEYERQVWIWTEKTGFKPISLRYAHLTNLVFSQSGKKVTASIRDINFNASNRFLVCTLDGKRELTYKMPKPQEVNILEGMSPILFNDESIALKDDNYPGFVCLWNVESETTKPFSVQGEIVYVYCFKGQVWGVRQVTLKERDIVRLSPDLKRIEEVIKL